ncbi:MarR family transcriptional regulator [Paraburkholderia ginsengiterrae]|uniref:MarR family transcriptional regulator n=1 Tax=Paraburkholderia ginsengiterrae TaxID=1462993 RepID=A0A1A9N3K5_9BURK|nr:MarR family transcriptional regulator [Paraburkholderia ginsengiterrae]OAJ57303.1 MarR family transcriptional regulator [Paraburkholderia ginsengiterrae]OAJ60917.1 MarR family transcriptional regulator [Paraburkholderia ginsengiterrae]
MKTPKRPQELELAIPYLLTRAGSRMGNAFAKALKPFGLSLSEWRVCASLLYVPRQTLSELSLHATPDISALSRIIDRLENEELVKRERSATDGRSIRIALTQKGEELALRIAPVGKQHEAVLLSGFAADDIQALRTMLLKLYENAGALDDLA